MVTTFKHYQSAHCENGVASNLLKHSGLYLSEPMVFGLGSGLMFVYLPFVKVNYAPAFSYRPLPGMIFSRMAKRLGIKIKRIKFSDAAAAQKALDANLKNNIPMGLQVGVYHLTYFPDDYRFHFNAHNLVVYGKTDTHYLISDPVAETVTTLTPQELERVRFAKGAFAPKGHMYYPLYIPKTFNLEKAIIKSIKITCRDMMAPFPYIGVWGIRHVAKQVRNWPVKLGTKKANHYLAQIVRMQEEIGTGGGGFRFIYAAFLQEAATILNKPALHELSLEMTAIGDRWRDFALEASRVYKKRSSLPDAYNNLADMLTEIADSEKQFFIKLRKAV